MYDITKRRSVRKYSDREVSDDQLRSLLQRAEQTQTMGNLQLYSVVINRSPEMKAKLAPAHFNQPMVEQAPVVLTFCADYNRCTKWCNERKATPGYDNFLSFLNAATDALLYCQTFCHLAEEEGLGLCFLGTTIYNAQQIVDTLQLPRLVMPVATITLGWPDEAPPVSDRLPLEAITHEETYKAYTAESINAFYSPKEELEENKQFVEINKKETLAQVFTDCRYRGDDCKVMSSQLLEVLKRQGFLN
ncbi:MAG: nitroreductase family protein [Bacteroidaceae bacterium]|nr:nitroreductase family protein [Bacteroidaceae bacterium]MBR3634377.1 nitroreductase family protein [Bacteroidaceae bacterium]